MCVMEHVNECILFIYGELMMCVRKLCKMKSVECTNVVAKRQHWVCRGSGNVCNGARERVYIVYIWGINDVREKAL